MLLKRDGSWWARKTSAEQSHVLAIMRTLGISGSTEGQFTASLSGTAASRQELQSELEHVGKQFATDATASSCRFAAGSPEEGRVRVTP